MNRRWIQAAALAPLLMALASCALLNTFVPPLEDPLGINGTEVTLQRSDLTTARLSPLQTSAASFTGTFETDIGDLEDPPLDPKSLKTELGFDRIALVGPAAALTEVAFPSTITVTAITLEVTVSDDQDPTGVSFSFDARDLSVGFERSECDVVNTDLACTYDPSADFLRGLDMTFSGDAFFTLFELLTNGTTPNVVEGSLSVAFDPDLDPAIQIAVARLATTDGRIAVF